MWDPVSGVEVCSAKMDYSPTLDSSDFLIHSTYSSAVVVYVFFDSV